MKNISEKEEFQQQQQQQQLYLHQQIEVVRISEFS